MFRTGEAWAGAGARLGLARQVGAHERVDAARERLLVISAGHPRRDIRELAEQAQVKLANLRNPSQRAVMDLLAHKNNPEGMTGALDVHGDAREALRSLIEATFTMKLGRVRITRAPTQSD